MESFNTSLLREKFTIYDAPSDEKRGQELSSVVAVSNRIVLSLANHLGHVSETIVVRAQTMHGCVRMAARVVQEFQNSGSILSRAEPIDWELFWMSINKGYEEKFNPDRWVAVYHKGRVIYEDGQTNRHPFLDIIEQCDSRNKDDYENVVSFAEEAFMKAGRAVTIEHDSNIALVLNEESEEIRCGIVVRAPNRTMTFSFAAKPKDGHKPRISQCLGVSAAFLEGIHLSYQIGTIRRKQIHGMIDLSSTNETEKSNEAMQRLGTLNDTIRQFEQFLKISYRPERPDFGEMIELSQVFTGQDVVRKT
jgi:hypothetical protein